MLRVSALLKEMRDLLPTELDAATTANYCRSWLLSLVARGVLTIVPSVWAPGISDAALALNVSPAALRAPLAVKPPPAAASGGAAEMDTGGGAGVRDPPPPPNARAPM